MVEIVKCSKCGLYLGPENYYTNHRRGLLCSWCKVCRAAYNRYVYATRVTRGLCGRCGYANIGPDNRGCVTCVVKDAAKATFGKRSLYKALLRIWYAQGGLCAITGDEISIGVNASVDHIVPRSKGGSNDISNLRWVSRDANMAKSTLTDAELLDLARKIINGPIGHGATDALRHCADDSGGIDPSLMDQRDGQP